MAVARFQVSVPFAPDLPENVVVNTLYFNDTFPAVTLDPAGTDWTQLANDVATLWQNNVTGSGTLRPIRVKVYDAKGTPPNDPLVDITKNPTGTLVTPTIPTEIAMCLSFKGGQRPWQRGRIYLPCFIMGGMNTGGVLGSRPTQAQMDQCLLLADGLAGIGGLNIDWSVFSRKLSTQYKVTTAWADDAWDTQRRRGLAPTRRTSKGYSG
jgi:hypothetical protein